MLPLHRIALSTALAVVIACAGSVGAGDLDISYTLVRGHIVQVEVRNEDQTPAKGVKVSLFDADKKLIQEGKINADGEWSWPTPGPGSYEVVVDPGTGANDITRIPVQVKPTALPAPEPDPDRPKCDHCPPPAPAAVETPAEETPTPWVPAGLALGAIGACGLALWLGRSWGQPASS